MFKKTYSKTGTSCRVTFKFEVPPGAEPAQTVHIVGEFNDWDKAKHKMKPRKGGSFSTTISLKSGRSYRFRYLLDGERWENDEAADGYPANDQGGDDSLIEV